jgi:hypothetical protein
VKAKAKTKGGKAKASAVANVTINMAKRGGGGGNRAPRNTPRFPFMGAGQGNIALENQFGRLFQQIQSNLIPKTGQGQPVAPPEIELPEQKQNNIIHLGDLANHPVVRDLHRQEFIRDQFDRNEALSHSYDLDPSIDSGDPSQVRSIPFSRASFGSLNDSDISGLNLPNPVGVAQFPPQRFIIEEENSNAIVPRVPNQVAFNSITDYINSPSDRIFSSPIPTGRVRLTAPPTSNQVAIYGVSPYGYYGKNNQPRVKPPQADERSYISERTGLPKLERPPRGNYNRS